MNKLFFLCLQILVLGCSNNEIRTKEIPTIVSDTSIVTARDKEIMKVFYREKENATLDSISKYNLYNPCKEGINILYSIYAPRKLYDRNLEKDITIGECDIRVLSFKSMSPFTKRVMFEIFTKDSLPLNSDRIFDNVGVFIYAFDIDITKGKILYGLLESDTESKIELENLMKLAKKERGSDAFKRYLKQYNNALSQKCLNAFQHKL